MDLGWLEDFTALIDTAQFSEAAERRNISQSAFSRRVKALEDWVGIPLFSREPHGVALTSAGRQFRPLAEDALRKIYLARDRALGRDAESASTLRFCSTHALSQFFFPSWFARLQEEAGRRIGFGMVVDNMSACERLMHGGRAQLLLCHHHPAVPSLLTEDQFESITISRDLLIPVSRPRLADPGQPRFALPGDPGDPLPWLAYSPESGIGRIVSATLGLQGRTMHAREVFASYVATTLLAAAKEGLGFAWLPGRLIRQELAGRQLVRAADGRWDIPVQIRLVRDRTQSDELVDEFWAMAVHAAAEASRSPAFGLAVDHAAAE